MRLVIASNNAHKVAEIKAILAPYYDEILSLKDAGITIDVVEDGETFEDNARKKAEEVLAVAHADAVLSDDSGLMVDALGGAPAFIAHAMPARGMTMLRTTQSCLKPCSLCRTARAHAGL